MPLTLITGANRGLGLEAARRLIGLGHTVYLGARDPEKGAAAAASLGARFVQLDITDDASVDLAASAISRDHGYLDVLINNAGIAGSRVPAADVTPEVLRPVYETNVFGTVRVIHAMLPLLRESSAPVIVNVTSGLGSFGRITDPERLEFRFPAVAYGSSKAALTAITVQYAKAFSEVRINAVDPGYTATDFNGHSGVQTIEEGTDAIIRLATFGSDGPTGTLSDRNGPMPW